MASISPIIREHRLEGVETKQRNGFSASLYFYESHRGGDHGDDTFKDNFEQARRHGFIRGAYHFFTPRTDALKQADFFIRTVKLDSGDLPPVLDVELTGKRPKKSCNKILRNGSTEWRHIMV